MIAGGTGYVGGRLIPELLNRGIRVRVLARTPQKLQGRGFAGHPALEVLQGDVLDAASVARVAHGCDVAYYLVHSMGSGRDYRERDQHAARIFGTQCAAAGIKRIIYLSGLGDSAAGALSEHLASRQQTGDALRSGGAAVTELRAGIIIGSGSLSFEIIHDLARRLPVMVAPRWLNSRTEPIAIRDVIAYLVGVLDAPATEGDTFEIGSGEQLPFRMLLQICGEELGRRPRILTVPILTPRLSSYWLHLVTNVDMNVARPLIEGLRNDSVCTGRRIRDLVHVEPTPYRTALQLAFARREDQTTRWSKWTDARRRSAAATTTTRHRHTYVDERVFTSTLAPDRLFDRVMQIGGNQGYGGGLDALWRARGMLDRLLGGPGFRRGRPSGHLHIGDPIDFWRVEHVERPHRLSLIAEMLVPGIARLEFRIEPEAGGGSRLLQCARLETNSLRGTLYWYAVYPIHGLVFKRMGRELVTPR